MKKKSIVALLTTGAIATATPFFMDFLARWEGREYVVYADKLAGGLPTVCKGITKWTSPYPVVVGERWSKEKCDAVEKQVTVETQQKLAMCIRNQGITQHVFDALSSHAHNVGVNATCQSRAVRLINAGKIKAGCDALAHGADGKPVWSYANGRFVQGLYNRRLAERELCLNGL
ncbi:lysozyme [Pelistega ratti]|uniref:lysozyme n=1 Tax=Pelistega ratti TaxID=2652177 RepID=UPI0013599E8D|nr:lysozyme [Pelistega ratti]